MKRRLDAFGEDEGALKKACDETIQAGAGTTVPYADPPTNERDRDKRKRREKMVRAIWAEEQLRREDGKFFEEDVGGLAFYVYTTGNL